MTKTSEAFLKADDPNEPVEIDGREFVPSLSGAPFTFDHQLGNTHVMFNPLVERDNALASGQLEVLFEDAYPEITNTQKAERGSLLYDIRRSHYDIASHHDTDYIEPIFQNYAVAGEETEKVHQWETVAELVVPADPDQEEMEYTVEALSDISVAIDGLQRSLRHAAIDYAEEYGEN